MRDVILESNPLLEAFGNAKTIRNNNSSRFGKYMEIQFDRGGDPRGGKISNYLLEKSRVIFQNRDERGFHIFYQMLAGADASMRDAFRLQEPSYYNYLNQSGCYTVEGTNDVEEWNDVLKAMQVMGFSEEEKTEIFRLVASILWLGNITFADTEKEEAYIMNEDTLDLFAYLIQSDSNTCRNALVTRTIQTGTQGRSARLSTYGVPQNAAGATYSRDALAKAIYSRLFDYIIARVNQSLGWNPNDGLVLMGILDIYGFEIFDINGFEQVCINYVNEKLQQIFINLTLKEEQEEYDREQIPWEPIQFFNNKICCDLVESKRDPIGILTLLDDTCNFPSGTDEKFLEKLQQHHSQHAHFGMGQRQHTFIIRHYAGDVEYLVDGMLDKNRDALYNDLINLAQCTNSWLLPTLFPEAKTADDKRRPTTAGFKIKESIQALVAALSKCHPHYIRCIKPNDRKRANDFAVDRVTHQVKYLGLLENVKVRRAGYAYRQLYDKFYYRYAICFDETWPPEKFQNRFKDGCLMIMQKLNLQPDGKKQPYAAGATKIFIRAPESVFTLEETRERKTFTYANRIQRFFLKYANDYYIYTLKKGANDALRGKKDRRRNSLERAYNGDYINYRENFALKGIVGRDVKVFFADVCDIIIKGKLVRAIIIITGMHIFCMMIDKNIDKATKKTKPFIYKEVFRCEIGRITSITFSTMADNFFVLVVPGMQDQMLSNGKKTEILATLVKLRNNISVQFSDLIMLTDIKQKKTKYQFVPNPTAVEGGLYKSKKVLVAPGAGKDAYPNITEPPKPVHTKTEYVPASRPAAAPVARPGPTGGGPKKMMMGGPPKQQMQAPRQAAPADDWGEEEDANDGYAPRPPVGGGVKRGGPVGGPAKRGGPVGGGGPPKRGGPAGGGMGGPKRGAPAGGMGGPKRGAPAGGARPAPPGAY